MAVTIKIILHDDQYANDAMLIAMDFKKKISKYAYKELIRYTPNKMVKCWADVYHTKTTIVVKTFDL